MYLCNLLTEKREFSSVGSERLPYKQRVGGSNPSTPTKERSLGNSEASFFLSVSSDFSRYLTVNLSTAVP